MYISGEPLKFLRNTLKLTRKELAEKSGVSERTIETIEDGQGNPAYTTLALLADTLSVPLDILCNRNIDYYHLDSNEHKTYIEYYDEEKTDHLPLLLSYLQFQNAYNKNNSKIK